MNDPGSAPLRVVIADDHPLVRSGLRTILTAAEPSPSNSAAFLSVVWPSVERYIVSRDGRP